MSTSRVSPQTAVGAELTVLRRMSLGACFSPNFAAASTVTMLASDPVSTNAFAGLPLMVISTNWA
ncbi:hypothetical protein L3055_11055, partial [Corynebacterium sp. MC-02]|nr:hypothetical protein [Corynebacterium pseudokroppenstedtii]